MTLIHVDLSLGCSCALVACVWCFHLVYNSYQYCFSSFYNDMFSLFTVYIYLVISGNLTSPCVFQSVIVNKVSSLPVPLVLRLTDVSPKGCVSLVN